MKAAIIGLACATALAVTGLGASQAPRPVPFNVAAVAWGPETSALEPIARFTGATWVNSWPAADEMNVAVPGLDSIPAAWLGKAVPRWWTAWSGDGKATRVHVEGTRRGGACYGLIDLTIDRRLNRDVSRSPSDFKLAVDTDQVVGTIRRLPASPPLTRAIREAFERQGAGELADVHDAGSVPPGDLAAVVVATGDFVINSIVEPRSSSPMTVAHFEASRMLAKDSPFGFAVSGWIARTTAGSWTTFGVARRLLFEDSGPVPGLIPLGWFHLNGHEYWIVESVGYEGAAILIYDVAPGRVMQVLETELGGC